MRRALIISLVALLPSVALATTGLVRFSAPQRILAITPPSHDFVLYTSAGQAINASGQAITLRPLAGGVALQLATASGSVRTASVQSTISGYNDPAVVINNAGALAATWNTVTLRAPPRERRLEIALGSVSTPPTTATIVPTGTDAFGGAFAYETPHATAVFIWAEQLAGDPNYSVRALIVPAGAAIPAPVTLDPHALPIGGGVDSSGDVIVIDAAGTALIEHRIAPDGTIGPAQHFTSRPLTAAALPGDEQTLGVLVDGSGDQLFYWSRSPIVPQSPLHVQWRSAAGALGPVQLLGTSDAGAGVLSPAVAINGAGNAVAVLTPSGAGPIAIRFASRLGAFGTPRALGSAKRFVSDPSLSIDGSGRVLVTWLDSQTPLARFARAVYAEAHGTAFGAPAPLAFQTGIANSPMIGPAPGIANVPAPGWLPFASAAPRAAEMVVTYAGRATSSARSPTAQIDFPLS